MPKHVESQVKRAKRLRQPHSRSLVALSQAPLNRLGTSGSMGASGSPRRRRRSRRRRHQEQHFEIEWPPKGGRMPSFPEIDRAAWFDLPVAHVRYSKASGRFSIGSLTLSHTANSAL